MIIKPKPCKHCGKFGHWPYQCIRNPNRPQYNLNKRSKHQTLWNKVRRQWFMDHPASSYHCYICGKYLLPYETTLDHVQPKGSHVKLRYDPKNLEPCCYPCNTEKGSRSLEAYIKERDLFGEFVTDYARKLLTNMA